MTITIAQAFAQWQEIAADLPQDDTRMLSESWNAYTDSLCKDGDLTDLQYHHCPAFDDTANIPGDDLSSDCEFLLSEMGVTFLATQVARRKDGLMQDAATHWEVVISRCGQNMQVLYSMGAAHTGVPSDVDVFNCVLRDADGVDESFEEWAENLGYDTDSRKAYAIWEACKETAYGLTRLFKPSELSDLRELLSDY